MDDVQISGLDELEAHIDELNADQTIPLREKLFDHVELQLTGSRPPIYFSHCSSPETSIH